MPVLPLLIIVLCALLGVAWLIAVPRWRSRRRRAWSEHPIPEQWHAWLAQHIPWYERMPPALRERLHGLLHVFLNEKRFVGCNGLVVSDEMRVVIAGYACLLVLNRPGVPNRDLYDELLSILVYPTAFIVREIDEEDGIVTEGDSVLSGQAWDSKRIILSWEDVQEARTEPANVVLHEFAHYLDMEDETMDGAPGLGSAEAYEQWSTVFWDEYERLIEELEAGVASLLDPYAATEPAEFFAVATETFFHQPVELRERHAQLYEQLRKYYRLDPASWVAAS